MNLDQQPEQAPEPNLGPTVSVAVFAKIGCLTYSTNKLRQEDLNRISVGAPVTVPLGHRSVQGIVVEKQDNAIRDSLTYQLKSVAAVHDEWPPLSPERVQWLQWISDYYNHPLGLIAQNCFPPLSRSTNRKRRKEAAWMDASETISGRPQHTLNEDQLAAKNLITQQLGAFGVHLLFGVTGSGKTEVYLEAIAECLQRGQTALVLVPEISLTPQLIDRFGERFPAQLAVIHSHLTPREKTDNWWLAVSGERRVLIGARSGLFCPLPHLGLIVIDEEHEPSFKQEDGLRYHARDSAIALARQLRIPVILGSATPSLESWSNATTGKYHLHRLPNRAASIHQLEFQVVDMREQRDQPTKLNTLPFWLSSALFQKIEANLNRREQSALFLNRRGVAQTVICSCCGDIAKCPNCSVSLTLHGRTSLVCHYCDYQQTKPEVCSVCKDGTPKPLGLGTELIEADLTRLFPTARLVRLDRDEIQSRTDLEDAIEQIESHSVDVIIGTQMIAKGLDFKKLSLVGVVMADVAFNMPDFRASERAFQLITQVAGRAGRHLKDRAGEVVIQTYNPDHPAIVHAIQSETESFLNQELNLRSLLSYPPHGRLGVVRIAGPDETATKRFASQLADFTRLQLTKLDQSQDYQVLGPATAPLARLKSLYRFQILIKSLKPTTPLHRLLGQVLKAGGRMTPPRVRLSVDTDAQQLL